MVALEDDLLALNELDEYRVRSADLRDAGRKSLAHSYGETAHLYIDEERAPRSERAMVARALMAHEVDEYDSECARHFASIHDADVFSDDGNPMPILRAARDMHALVQSDQYVFTSTVMCLYYRLVREIYSAHPPEWVTGGTRASDAAPTTAYVSGECVRAILGLRRALMRRANYVDALADLHDKLDRLTSLPKFLSGWVAVESSRVAREFTTTFGNRKTMVTAAPGRDQPVDPRTFDRAKIDWLLHEPDTRMRNAFDGACEEFAKAEVMIRKQRRKEGQKQRSARELHLKRAASRGGGDAILAAARMESGEKARRDILLQHSETAHQMGMGAVEAALATARAGSAIFTRKEGTITTRLRDLKRVLMIAADEIKRLLQPAVGYLSRVLDRELALAASEDQFKCDFPELAFAAASFGAVSDKWYDERLRRATVVLSKHISERGRFPLGGPLQSTSDGYKAHVIGSEVIRAFSQLLENVSAVELEPHVVKSMMMYFDDTQIDRGIWKYDDAQQSETPQRWSSAFAVIALDRINRMLDRRIDDRVLCQFSWRKPEDIAVPKLDRLFYPDYGIAAGNVNGPCRDSVAVVLERIRAHVAGLKPFEVDREALYALVLYGPPGTGKTTLVESLAKSCSVPLVEVTPSDIVIGGGDAVERRARAVFSALSLLTRAVVMLDEFDPVLQERERQAVRPNSVFSFLTPGLLPKLKNLHEKAGRRGVAYVLVTNLIGTLDPAAIREGRFDAHVGIYSPDLLSRAGRFYSIVREFEGEPLDDERRRSIVQPTDAASGEKAYMPIKKSESSGDVVREIVLNTANSSMNTLGKRAWFTPPKERTDIRRGDGTPFSYYFFGDTKPQNHPLDRDPERTGNGLEAEIELAEWKWVKEWDAVLDAPGMTLERAIASAPRYERPRVSTTRPQAAKCEICRHVTELVDHLHSHSHGEVERVAKGNLIPATTAG